MAKRTPTRDPLKSRWVGMRQRCLNPKCQGFANYGGRGIAIDPEWDSFEMFAIWAYYSGYRLELQLDRIDNDGPYSPTNCRWVTPAANCRNRRPNRHINVHGENMVALDAARKYGVKMTTLCARLDRGDSPESALRKPNGGAFEYFGERMTLIEAERRFGLSWGTIHYRIRNGMTPEDAVTRPVRAVRPYERTNPRTGETIKVRASG